MKTRAKGDGSLYYDEHNGVWKAGVELPPVVIDGKIKRRRKTVSSKDKRKAMQKLRQVQRDLAEHGDLATSTMTFGTWAEHWTAELAHKTLRPSTRRGYTSALNRQLIPRLGPVKIDKLTAPMIRAAIDEIAATQKSSYAVYCFAVMSTILGAAREEQKINRHPMDGMSRPRHKSEEQNSLTAEQAIDLLEWLASDDYTHKTPQEAVLYATYLLTGARRNEVLGLEADRIADTLDLSWQVQRIKDITKVPADYEYRHITGDYYWARPKSPKSWRIIPLVDPLKSILETWVAAQGKTGLIFEQSGGAPLTPETVTDRWPEILVAAGIENHTEGAAAYTPPEKRVKLHGTRHTVVDLLYEAGVPEHIIQDIMGQSTRKVTRDYRSKRGKSQAMVGAMEDMVKLLKK